MINKTAIVKEKELILENGRVVACRSVVDHPRLGLLLIELAKTGQKSIYKLIAGDTLDGLDNTEFSSYTNTYHAIIANMDKSRPSISEDWKAYQVNNLIEAIESLNKSKRYFDEITYV